MHTDNPLFEIFNESEVRTLTPQEQTDFQVNLSNYMHEVRREYTQMEQRSLQKASEILLNI